MSANTLEARVHQFMSLELPGQPQAMHMGTFSLVGDLWAEVKHLRKEISDKAEWHCTGQPAPYTPADGQW